jgi:hypothetical protein
VPTSPDHHASRRCVLALSVLDDVDLVPTDAGVVLPGDPEVTVPWDRIALARGTDDPISPIARHRVLVTLRLSRLRADETGTAQLRHAARPLALPADHPLHPGPGWVRERLLGGALDLGIGILGPGPSHDLPVPLPPWLGIGRFWWPQLREHAERMGELARRRLLRDARGELRPIGGCDVLTLLASRTLRAELARTDRSGMHAVAAPRRQHAWTELSRIDPAYLRAVWALTDEQKRGIDRPLLVTRDEVSLPAPGGDPASLALG